ncbi:MAG TPA: hypothetical protein VM689_27075 [Aliidongia sp.]|nr:hypothetical protein [Aliidongia sp.]
MEPGSEKEAWLARVLGITLARRASPPEPDQDELRAAVRDLVQTLSVDLKLLPAAGSPDADLARSLFATGAAAARAQDYAAAFEALQDSASAVARARRAESAGEAAATVVPGTVAQLVRGFELAEAAWQTSRIRAFDGLEELVSLLRQDGDPELEEIALIIRGITDELPDELEAPIAALRTAAEAGLPLDAPRRAVEAAVAGAHAFVAANAAALGRCEDNPWGLDIAVVAPLEDALARISACLANI